MKELIRLIETGKVIGAEIGTEFNGETSLTIDCSAGTGYDPIDPDIVNAVKEAIEKRLAEYADSGSFSNVGPFNSIKITLE